MDRENLERLKLDVRLIRRRGWISSADLDRELAALPDASGKAVRVETQEPAGDAPPDDLPTP